ncbi:MAG: hypothetical protein BM562_07080 [Alphaproteobacteria bacterium MedPE-SWcel]|nr:MAG: hypothetical protein BM562_07080 [Alphaproteobacteria bacterium MedPE-SWcel]
MLFSLGEDGYQILITSRSSKRRVVFADLARLLQDLSPLLIQATEVPFDIGKIRLRITLQQIRVGLCVTD